jgi:ferredoxin
MQQIRELKISPPPEVDEPTYKVVDKIERVDQRDTMQSRAVLKPGTPEYEDYHKRHPEHKEWDDRSREVLLKATQRHSESDPLGVQLQPNVFSTRHILGAAEIVEGKAEETHLWEKPEIDSNKISPEELTERIKSYALFLGATKVKATRLREEWVYTHYAHPYSPEPYGKPVELDYKYIICLAMRQNNFTIQAGDGYIPSIEVGWRYAMTSLISVTLANLIRSWGFRARALTPENSPYMVVPTFIDAGMGEQCRMGHVLTKEFGNNFRPAAVATDMPMVMDKPVDFGLQNFCDKCEVCIDACPVGAIPKERTVERGVYRWQMDAKKCRMYWSSMAHSCAICQAACPWNFESNLFHDTIRNLNQYIPWFRKPAVWGYKLLYGTYKKKMDPAWAKRPDEDQET